MKSGTTHLCIIFFNLFFFIFVSNSYSQVTIGANIKPSGGAVLDIKERIADGTNGTSDRGIVLPRVALSKTRKGELHPMYNVTGADYIVNNTQYKKDNVGLTVYNITNDGFFVPGVYTWSGDEWRKIDDSPAAEAAITDLLCPNASMVPSSYESGVPFDGIIKIPYIGGTGGAYEASTSSASVNGLTIQRIPGKLSFGGGEVMYRISGTPTQSSPQVTKFPINFLGKSCEISVGSPSTSVNLRNLATNMTVNAAFTTTGSHLNANILPFGTITITESGSYAFSLRLYGRLSGGDETKRYPFYIYLQKNNKSSLVDAAEIDLAVVPTEGANYKDFSYSITLGGVFEAGETVLVTMCKPSSGPSWTLSNGGGSTSSPVRTSMIYWKL